MRVRVTLPAILVALCVGGCAHKPFESVVDEPRAKITLRKNTAASELRVLVFEPNAACDFDFKGRQMISGIERVRSFYVRPGRKYFRVTAEQGRFIGLSGGDVSFVTLENMEYVIEFKSLGAKFVGTGTELSYAINYLQGPLSDLKPVDVDHFAVCKRERVQS